MTTNRETTPPTPNAGEWKKLRDAHDRLIVPAAQDDPAKGLEVVAWRYEHPDRGGYAYTDWAEAAASIRGAQPLTDHATATRQIAELDARVLDLSHKLELWIDRWTRRDEQAHRVEARALAAEADAARVREALEAILKVQVYGHDNIWAGSHRCKDIARATLTQRGA